jgi:hypothetical protein
MVLMVTIPSAIATRIMLTIATLAIATITMLGGIFFEPLVLLPHVCQEILAKLLSSLNIFRIGAAVSKSAYKGNLSRR